MEFKRFSETLDDIRCPVIRHVYTDLGWSRTLQSRILLRAEVTSRLSPSMSLCISLHVCPLCTPTSSSPSPHPRRKEGINDGRPEQRARANQLVSEKYQLFWKKKRVKTASNSV